MKLNPLQSALKPHLLQNRREMNALRKTVQKQNRIIADLKDQMEQVTEQVQMNMENMREQDNGGMHGGAMGAGAAAGASYSDTSFTDNLMGQDNYLDPVGDAIYGADEAAGAQQDQFNPMNEMGIDPLTDDPAAQLESGPSDYMEGGDALGSDLYSADPFTPDLMEGGSGFVDDSLGGMDGGFVDDTLNEGDGFGSGESFADSSYSENNSW